MTPCGQSAWVVVVGEYSDAWPTAAFTTEDKAEAYVARQRATEPAGRRWPEAIHVEKVDLDPVDVGS